MELVTPAFIGGAFPQEEAQLRPASFIGILRWWFRNLALTYTDDIDAIYKLETELFGNNRQAGKVWVKFGKIIRNPWRDFRNYLSNSNNENNDYENSLKVKKLKKLSFGLTYLGYGNFSFVNCTKSNNSRKYPIICNKLQYFKGNINIKAFVPHGSTVDITFLVPNKYVNLLKNLLFIVSQLGALGGRNRRGWGSFYLHPKEKGKCVYWDSNRLACAYQGFIEELKLLLEKELGQNLDSPRPAQTIEIYVGNYREGSFLNLLNSLGRNYKNFRKQYRIPFDELKNALCNNRENYKICNKAWLGLPILKQKSKTEKIFINTYHFGKEKGRFASPVVFRVIKTKEKKENKYGILVIILYKPYNEVFGKFITVKATAKKDELCRSKYVHNKTRLKKENKENNEVEIEIKFSQSFEDFIGNNFLPYFSRKTYRHQINIRHVLTFPREAKDATQ